MDEKEKYRAKIDAKLLRFGETINEIKTNMEQRKENTPDIRLTPTLQKHEEARTKLSSLEQADKDSWHIYKRELDNLVNDIDEDLRRALAYFG